MPTHCVIDKTPFTRVSPGILWLLILSALLGAAPVYADSPNTPAQEKKATSQVRSLHVEVRGIDALKIEGKVRNHTLHTDNPKEWGGDDTAPNPAETFAFALGSCVVNTGRLIAKQEKLDLKQISVVVEGAVDMRKVLGQETSARAGFQGFTIEVHFEGGLSTAEKSKLLEEISQRCPLCDTVANTTPFSLKLKD